MMNTLRIYVVCGVLACLVALAFGADTCHGQAWNPAPLNYWYSYHPGPYGPYFPNAQRGIPHFAAFPPVYYSHIVPRPYGYSPYAYVPGVVTPSFELCQPRYKCWAASGRGATYGASSDLSPLVDSPRRAAAEPGAQRVSIGISPRPISIPNPYYSGDTGEAPRPERISGGPLRIQNPYFVERADPLAGG
jgi:hypothetical protein